MEKIWIDIFEEHDASKFSRRWLDAFFNGNKDDIFYTEKKGIFWADEIKKYKNIPHKRFIYAIRNLPLPAAFREAMIALRSIIRDNNKNNINCEEDYKLLYKIGVVNSMCIPYSNNLQQPGHNIFERIPGGMLFSLDIPYKKIGYNKIELFNKTDCKNFVNLWGEPELHQTMNTYYNDIWIKYERITKDDQAKHRLELHKIIDNMP